MSNLIGLVILIIGAVALNQYTAELVKARVENLRAQTSLITSVMADRTTGYGAAAQLDVLRAKQFINSVDLPPGWRLRLHGRSGELLADRESSDDTITVTTLGPIGEAPEKASWGARFNESAGRKFSSFLQNLPGRTQRRETYRHDLQRDIRRALDGASVGGERYDAGDNLLVTMTMPVMRVQEVLGVVTLESADVNDIIAGERQALVPFIGLAMLAALLSSIALTLFIALPLRQLSQAASAVARSNTKRGKIPDFSSRKDEIGDLSVMLRDMTNGLYSRIDDIANFAADVAHEIKNPLTSLRSASDTLSHAKTDEQRRKLIDIIQADVGRMDRLISDISQASKVDANLARETSQPVNIFELLDNITEFYQQTGSGESASVEHIAPVTQPENGIYIRAFETPFAQVLRNLIDNALTFSPPDGSVRLKASLDPERPDLPVKITVDDDGPGIPPDNMETIFERFYTERPKGARFGSHSGLGLAICRQIITAHKGKIHAENRKKEGQVKGAKFVIYLPRADSD